MFMKKILAHVLVVSAFVLLAGLSAPKTFAENGKNGNDNKNEQRGLLKDDHGNQKREANSIGSTLEVHIGDDGMALVRGAKVTGISGNTISATTSWGSVVLNWSVVTDSNTQFVRRFGGASSVSEISVNDFISFNGAVLTTTASPITVQAKVVKDWSVQRAHATFNGSVTSVNTGALSFVLQSEDRGAITVNTDTNTKIMKGGANGVFADVIVGAKVTASGLFNNLSKILDGDNVKVHLAGATRTTVEGKVKSVPVSGTAPTTFVLTSDNKDYTINLGVDTSVLNNFWLKLSIGSIQVNDKIRVYGTVNTDNTVDATVVRDTNK